MLYLKQCRVTGKEFNNKEILYASLEFQHGVLKVKTTAEQEAERKKERAEKAEKFMALTEEIFNKVELLISNCPNDSLVLIPFADFFIFHPKEDGVRICFWKNYQIDTLNIYLVRKTNLYICKANPFKNIHSTSTNPASPSHIPTSFTHLFYLL